MSQFSISDERSKFLTGKLIKIEQMRLGGLSWANFISQEMYYTVNVRTKWKVKKHP